MSPRRARGAHDAHAPLNGLRAAANGSLAGVSEIQRARLLAATARVVVERGAANVTVAHIVERAGVSRRTFYEIFKDAQHAMRCALEDALACAGERVGPAWRSEQSWRGRVRDSLAALLALFDEDPTLARLLVVESLACGQEVLGRRSQVLGRLAGAVAEGEREPSRGTEATRLTAEGAVGGVLAILHERICQPSSERPLIELAGPLTSMIVLPYEGRTAAGREAARPAPAPAPRSNANSDAKLSPDPFKAAGMRLTYRTMRVLAAVAEHPGRSNREIGALAEMTDQGQVSKLLRRLEGVALVVNEGAGHARGEANAWSLTDAGRQVAAAYISHPPVRSTTGRAR